MIELNLLGAFLGDDLSYERGVRVYVKDGAVADIEKGGGGRLVAVPALINSHVHTGDFLFNEAGAGLSLEELVAPPSPMASIINASASSISFKTDSLNLFIIFKQLKI